MAEGEKQNEIEETLQNKATNGRTKGRKWSDQETNLLIDLLEEHTCLWDVYSKEYHLRNARERAYEKMKGELNIELADIKTKIMNLRSQLGREIAKSKAKKSGQARSECYKSSWAYWDRLQFLVPVMQAGKSKDTLPTSRSSTPESVDNEDCLDDSTLISVDEEDENPSPSSICRKGKYCKKATDLESKARNELLSTCVQVLKEPLPFPTPEPQAKRQCPFSLYIAEKLSGFDKCSRMIAEKRISDIIFEMEMGIVNANEQQQSHWQDIPPQGYMNMLQNQQVYR